MNATFDGDVVGRVRASLSAVAASTPIGPDRWNAVVDVSAHRQRTFAASFAVAASAAVVVGAAGAIAVAQHGGPVPAAMPLSDPPPSASSSAVSALPAPSRTAGPATAEQLRGLTFVLASVPKGYHVGNAYGAVRQLSSGGDRTEWQIVYAPDPGTTGKVIGVNVYGGNRDWVLPTQYGGEVISVNGNKVLISMREGPDVEWRVGDAVIQVTVESGTRQELIDAASAVVQVSPDDPRAAVVNPPDVY